MVPCVDSGRDFKPHIIEVARFAQELTIIAIDTGDSESPDLVPFLKHTHNICPHTARVILYYIALNATGGRDAMRRVRVETQGLIDFIQANYFD